MPLSGMPRPPSTLDARLQGQDAAEVAAAEPGATTAGPSTTHPDTGCGDGFVAFAARVGGERGGWGCGATKAYVEVAKAKTPSG